MSSPKLSRERSITDDKNRRGTRSRTYSRSISRSRSRSRGYRRESYSRSRSVSRGGYRRSNSRSPLGNNKRRNTGPRDKPKPSRCLGVFGLSLRTRERDLYDIFERYGDIEDITLVFDNYTGRSRGFGFVYFRHMEDAKSAKEDSYGVELDGRIIRVDYSVTDRPHSPTPGVYLGKPTRRRSPPRYAGRRRRSFSRSQSRSPRR